MFTSDDRLKSGLQQEISGSKGTWGVVWGRAEDQKASPIITLLSDATSLMQDHFQGLSQSRKQEPASRTLDDE